MAASPDASCTARLARTSARAVLRVYASISARLNRGKARQLFAQACTGTPDVAESCAYLGAGYLRGSGVMRDDVRAGQYLSQGREGGVAVGCTALASMYETGSSVTATSVTRAAGFYSTWLPRWRSDGVRVDRRAPAAGEEVIFRSGRRDPAGWDGGV